MILLLGNLIRRKTASERKYRRSYTCVRIAYYALHDHTFILVIIIRLLPTFSRILMTRFCGKLKFGKFWNLEKKEVTTNWTERTCAFITPIFKLFGLGNHSLWKVLFRPSDSSLCDLFVCSGHSVKLWKINHFSVKLFLLILFTELGN